MLYKIIYNEDPNDFDIVLLENTLKDKVCTKLVATSKDGAPEYCYYSPYVWSRAIPVEQKDLPLYVSSTTTPLFEKIIKEEI